MYEKNMQALNRCANVNATFTIIKLTLYKENLHFPFVVILHVSITIIRNSPFFLYGSNYIGKFLCLKYSHSTLLNTNTSLVIALLSVSQFYSVNKIINMFKRALNIAC